MGRHRMILSLSDDLHAILMELSKETGTPAATFVVELIESSKYEIAKITEAVKHAKNNQKNLAMDNLNEMVSNASSNLGKYQQILEEEKQKDQR